jgi:hypothetical protein
MNRMMLVAVSLAAVGLAGCGKGGSLPGVFNQAPSTPQAVFDRASAAAAKSDWKTVFECLDPDKADHMLFGMTLVGGLAAGADQAAKAEYESIVKRHGVVDMKGRKMPLNDEAKMEPMIHEMFGKVSDKPGYYSDLMTFLAKRPGTSIGKDFGGTLKDVKETGDTATGTVVQGDGKSKPMRFVKRSKGWYIDPTLQK